MQTAKFTELPESTSLPSIYRLEQEHSLYARRLETLRAKLFLTEAGKAGRGTAEEAETEPEG